MNGEQHVLAQVQEILNSHQASVLASAKQEVAVLEAEHNLPQPKREQRQVNFRGFNLTEEVEAIDESVDIPEEVAKARKKLQAQQNFSQRQMNFAAEVARKVGQPPIAVITRKAFNKMTRLAGIIRFERWDEEGRVAVHNSKFLNKAYSIFYFIMIPSLIFAFAALIYPFMQDHTNPLVMSILLIVCAIVNAFLAAFVMIVAEALNKSALKRQVRKGQPITEALWPEFHSDFWSKLRAPIQFIDAPESFKAILTKARSAGYEVNIAATPEAVKVELDDLVRAPAPEAEPMAYIISPCGQFVAILDQFGDFPNEKQVIDWAKTEGLNVCFN